MEFKDRDSRWTDKDVDNILLELDLLRKKYEKVQEQLFDAEKRNQKMVKGLQDSKEQLTALKEEVDKLCAPPNTYGVFTRANKDGTAEILSEGRPMRVNVHPNLDPFVLEEGQLVVLNEAFN
ncbi:MAG: hypothetical protein KC466_07495, partial [Myxococcales bacterium]|nr:hypothetical protein [Myxococcales bacterium]